MTQDEIIEMARQAGIENNQYMIYEALAHTAFVCAVEELEAFARLVAAKERDRMCKQCNWSKHENATCNEANQPKILGES